jgi:hypothetical protein
MVDRQTPTVASDEETVREAEVARETEEHREPEGHPEREATGERDSGADPGPTRVAPIDRADRPSAGVEPAGPGGDAALFDPDRSQDLQERWLVIQTEFVDEPRQAVEKAEGLVGEVMQTLTEGFARERRDLEGRWSGDGDPSTEDLRQAIRRYRSFFNRLLSI